MGQPTECAHPDAKGVTQRTSTGLAYYITDQNFSTFSTDWASGRAQSWGLLPGGLQYVSEDQGSGAKVRLLAFADADCVESPADVADPESLSTYCAQVATDTAARAPQPQRQPAAAAAVPTPAAAHPLLVDVAGPDYLGQSPDGCVAGVVAGIQVVSCTYPNNAGAIWTSTTQGWELLSFGPNGVTQTYTEAGRRAYGLVEPRPAPVSIAPSSGSTETTIYDATGVAAAYIAKDDESTIYLWAGKPVAYLYDDRDGSGVLSIYRMDGHHLGWLANGLVRDHNGYGVGFLERATTVTTQPEPFKGFRQFKPSQGLRQLEPLRPLDKQTWSEVSLRTFLTNP